MSEKQQPKIELGYVRMPKRLEAYGQSNPVAMKIIGMGLMQLVEINRAIETSKKLKTLIMEALTSEKVVNTVVTAGGTKEEYLEFLNEAVKSTEEGHVAKFELTEEEFDEVQKKDPKGQYVDISA